MLSLRVRVDLGAMAMNAYSALTKAPALLKHHHQNVKCHAKTLLGGVLPLCRDLVGVF